MNRMGECATKRIFDFWNIFHYSSYFVCLFLSVQDLTVFFSVSWGGGGGGLYRLQNFAVFTGFSC